MRLALYVAASVIAAPALAVSTNIHGDSPLHASAGRDDFEEVNTGEACRVCYSSFCADSYSTSRESCDTCIEKHESKLNEPDCRSQHSDCYAKAEEWCAGAPTPDPLPAPAPAPAPHAHVPIYDGRIRIEGDGLLAAYMAVPPGGTDNHAATLAQLPDGTLVSAWFSGDHEEASNLAIAVSRLEAGTQQWTNATLLAQKEGYASQNPLLFHDNTTGILHLFHTRAKADSGESAAEIYRMTSTDGGVSWSDTKKYLDNSGVFTRNAIIRRKDDTLLWPFYSTNANGGMVPMFAWTNTTSVPDSGSGWTQRTLNQGNASLEQPTCWRLPHDTDTIECYFRDCNQQNIYSASSTDEGESFSVPARTTLPNPGSGIEGCPLDSGDLILIYNPTSGGSRDPLAAGISSDDGKSWKSRNVQHGPTGVPSAGPNEFSYPTVLQTPDGNIHVMYTYAPTGVDQAKTMKYIQFSEDWVTSL